MEDRTFNISLHKNPLITIETIPGHFATGGPHVSHYLNMSGLKSIVSSAKEVAKEMAIPYLTSSIVNTIVCMDDTEVIGAYLADELLQSGVSVVNSHSEICVVSPIYNVNRKLFFHNNIEKMITNHNIVLMVASVSSGSTIHNAMECIEYYGGKLVGISALFSALDEELPYPFYPVFTTDDIPQYSFYSADKCIMCNNNQKLDAIVSREGYTKI